MAHAWRVWSGQGEGEGPAVWRWHPQEGMLAGGEDSALHFFCKRTLDVALAGALLVLLAPLMGLIALLIRLDSSGPALFVQRRVGARRRSRGGASSGRSAPSPSTSFAPCFTTQTRPSTGTTSGPSCRAAWTAPGRSS